VSLDVTGKYRYPAPDINWLNQCQESEIEPDLPIIDSHHHLWEQDGCPYYIEDLNSDTSSGHNITATVCVEARFRYRKSGPIELRPVGETEEIVRMTAANSPTSKTQFCAGLVAHADLTLGDQVAEVLDAHIALAGDRLKGIRHSVARDEHFPNGIVIRPAPGGLLADAGYRQGLARLVNYELSYDAMLYHRQIPDLAKLAQGLPDLPVILNHYGCILGVGYYEGREDETFIEWRRAMQTLSERPNVLVKIGGLGMIVCGARYHERPVPPGSDELASEWRPYVETCIELFGPERCMFESNFPVDKAMYSYTVLWNAFKKITAAYSASERAALFHDTAAAVYRL
jgi:predicted TIM-barrel fold metal-dependent hydrolase